MNAPETLRLDKWLWQARFFKTRTLAAKTVSTGKVRVNAARVKKPATSVKCGDGLTFTQGETVRIVRIAALGARRGPATEAQALYEDLTPIQESGQKTLIERVGARPTKKTRRAMEAIRRAPS